MDRPPPDRAIMLALAALYEATNAASAAPMKPSLSQRALLALLFERSDGTRAPYDAFWRTCQEAHSNEVESAGGYLRATWSRTQWLGIARSLGIEPRATTFHQAIQELIAQQRAAIDPEARDCRVMAAALEEAKFTREIVATKGHPHSKRGRELAPKIIDRLLR